MSGPGVQFLERVRLATVTAMKSLAKEEELAVKKDIDIPIEYLGDGQAIHSAPGEPPRRGVKTHPLQDSVKSAVMETPNAVVGAVGAGPVYDQETGEEYSARLEIGGWYSTRYKEIVAPRPYISVSMNRVESDGFPFVIKSIKETI